MTTAADLGPGVGIVPRWWMEITPHYVLDREQDALNRIAEENMSYFYQQMDRCKDGQEFLGPDGKPIIGYDGQPLRGLPTTWGGRGAGGAHQGDTEGGCFGRNFKVGSVTPETLALLGIRSSHADYQSFLSGSKMPPGYWDLLSALGYEGIANNLKQTSFGKYGRQAEQPKFKPAWATKNLRSTDSGAKIRQGQYDDSPNKFSRRTVTNAALEALESRNVVAGPPLDVEPAQQEQYQPPAASESRPSVHAKRQSSKVIPPQQHREQQQEYDEDEDDYEEEYEEEVVEEEYEEEDNAPAQVDAEVEDLQKILAEKMAELARLQAGG